MATLRKGSGTTVRRRTKSAAKQAVATVHESNGKAHNGVVETAPKIEANIETIRVRAYDLFLARGAIHGQDLADWLNAERELLGVQKP